MFFNKRKSQDREIIKVPNSTVEFIPVINEIVDGISYVCYKPHQEIFDFSEELSFCRFFESQQNLKSFSEKEIKILLEKSKLIDVVAERSFVAGSICFPFQQGDKIKVAYFDMNPHYTGLYYADDREILQGGTFMTYLVLKK